MRTRASLHPCECLLTRYGLLIAPALLPPHGALSAIADRSGNVTYDELYRVCRAPPLHRGLGLRQKDLPDAMLRALWCALDDNDSSTVKHDEFIRFLRLAPGTEEAHAGYVHSKDYDAHEASMAIRREGEAMDTKRVDYARTTKEVCATPVRCRLN